MKTTNYFNTLILPSEDSQVIDFKIPKLKSNGEKSIALMQYEKMMRKPYEYTSDELLFEIHLERMDVSDSEKESEKKAFFSKPKACLRTSPLCKSYGWAIHFNTQGKISLIPMNNPKLEKLISDDNLSVVHAMKMKK